MLAGRWCWAWVFAVGCGGANPSAEAPAPAERPTPPTVAPAPDPTAEPDANPVPPLERDDRDTSGHAADQASRAAHAAIQHRQLGAPLPASEHVFPVALENAEALADFHAALRRLEAGRDTGAKVRILAWGASSTAGDRYTGYLRGYLQHRFGDGGPGFVAAVPLWKWHRHQDIDLDASGPWVITHSLRPKGRSDGRYGLLGARATGRYAGTRVTVSLADPRATAERWSLWYLTDPRGGAVSATLDDEPSVRIDTRAENVSPAYAELSTDAPHARLRLAVAGGGPVRLFGAVIERAQSGVVVDELGIGGSGARRVLHWDEELWVEHVRRREPALVIFAYGGIEAMRKVHDPARFRREWVDILARVRRAAPEASCLLVAPQDLALRKGGKRRRRPDTMDSILEVIRDVARTEGCALFETPTLMGGPGSMRTWVDAGLAMKDHVHFTKAGYAHLGHALAEALMAGYDPEP